jgi:hypothetical protein
MVYPTRKFVPKHFGPFKIIQKISQVNYKLELPNKWKVHPVFHIALLAPYIKTPEYGRPHA